MGLSVNKVELIGNLGRDPETDVFQLLASLLVYCDHHGIDFETAIKDGAP